MLLKTLRYACGLVFVLVVGISDYPAFADDIAENEIPPRLPVEAFAALPAFLDVTLAPDGQHYAYMMAVEGRYNVFFQPIKGGFKYARRIPPIKKADIMWFRWANAEQLLVAYEIFDRDFYYGARTETRLVGFKIDGSAAESIVRHKFYSGTTLRKTGQIETKIVDMLHDDPEHIVMALDMERKGNYALARINLNTRGQKRIPAPAGDIQNWMMDQGHQARMGWGYNMSKRKAIYRNPATNKWDKLHKTDWYEDGFHPLAFFEDPTFAYAIGPQNGREVLVKLNIPEGEVEETLYAHETVDISGIVTDHTGQKVIGVRYTDDYSRVHYFDGFYQRMQVKIDQLLPDTNNRIVDALPDKKLYLILAYNDRIEGDYYVLDLTGKQLYYLVSQRGELDERQMAKVTPVTYEARDGLEIPAYLTLPKGRVAKNLPTIILPHGGPHSRSTQSFHYLSQFLANRGYAVLRPNFRGSTGFGTAFERLGKKKWGGVMQDDVTDGAQWLIDQGIADHERMCIVGWSYGGYAALMGAIKTPDLFKCAASINGVADLPGLVAYDKKFIGGRYWLKIITNDEEGRKAVSPLHQSKRINIPVFLAASKDDVRVPYKQSKKLYKKIRKRVPATYVEIKAGGHSLDHEKGRIKMLKALEKFLEENIGADNIGE